MKLWCFRERPRSTATPTETCCSALSTMSRWVLSLWLSHRSSKSYHLVRTWVVIGCLANWKIFGCMFHVFKMFDRAGVIQWFWGQHWVFKKKSHVRRSELGTFCSKSCVMLTLFPNDLMSSCYSFGCHICRYKYICNKPIILMMYQPSPFLSVTLYCVRPDQL